MNDGIIKGAFAPLAKVVGLHETAKVYDFCRDMLERAGVNGDIFPHGKTSINRNGNVMGGIAFSENNGRCIISISDKPDGVKEIHHDYAFDRAENTVLYTKYQMYPTQLAICTKYKDDLTVMSEETIVPSVEGYSFSQEEQESTRQLMCFTTPFLKESLAYSSCYEYAGKASIGLIKEGVYKDSRGFNYTLAFCPAGTPSNDCHMLLVTDEGKVEIVCDGPNRSRIDYETFAEEYPFDKETIKAKIAILSEMGFDISDVPKSLKPDGKGQK